MDTSINKQNFIPEQRERDREPRRRKKKGVLVALVVLFLLFVGTASAAIYFYMQSRTPANQEQASSEEVKRIVEEVGKIMVLPEHEVPTLATVTDAEKLKGQPFFAKAKVGDKVLMYATARKVILYDPESQKVVEVAGITIDAAPRP